MRASLRNTGRALLVVSLGLTAPRIAFGQTATDSASAQAMFDQGKQLMADGKYVEACPKLEESQRLDPGSGTLLNLADCYEHAGKLATAWSKFLEAASAARQTGNGDRENTARQRAAALAPKLSKIVINVATTSTVDGLEVKRDGINVGAAQWGSAMPVDAGQHTVSASAPGRKPWTAAVTVTGQAPLTVTVPELQSASRMSAAEPPPGSAPGAAPPPTEPATSGSGGLGTQKNLALVAGGVGVVGLGLGTVFGLQSKSKHDEAANHCDGSACRDQQGVDLKSEAMSAGNIATVGFVVGAVGLAGGAVLWFTAKPGGEGASTQVGIGPGRVILKGAW